jgi:hypothetical protein
METKRLMVINDNIHDNFKTRFLHKFYEIDLEFTLIFSPLALFWHYYTSWTGTLTCQLSQRC